MWHNLSVCCSEFKYCGQIRFGQTLSIFCSDHFWSCYYGFNIPYPFLTRKHFIMFFLLWTIDTCVFLKFYILFKSLIWIWIKVKWMTKRFWYTILYYLVLTEATSLFHQQVAVRHIWISSEISFCLWRVKVSCLLYPDRAGKQ